MFVHSRRLSSVVADLNIIYIPVDNALIDDDGNLFEYSLRYFVLAYYWFTLEGGEGGRERGREREGGRVSVSLSTCSNKYV